MASFLLTWDPAAKENDARRIATIVRRTASGSVVSDRWSIGNRVGGVEPGDRLYLFRQRSDRGLVGAGVATSEVFRDRHWRFPTKTATYVRLRWESWLEAADRLPIEELERDVPRVAWNRLQASGVALDESSAIQAERVWRQHLAGLGRAVHRSADEVSPGERYVEGAVTRVLVNRYERDARAREECIAHWGARCSVCDFDFGAVYGRLGEGYIHVHHLEELASLGGATQVDARRDLRPVCPNCHAMLHQEVPALTIAALKRRLRKNPLA